MAPNMLNSWHYGRLGEPNLLIFRDLWMEPYERQAICDFPVQFPLGGYRRMTFMMFDAAWPEYQFRVSLASGNPLRFLATVGSRRYRASHQTGRQYTTEDRLHATSR
jgi:hypothetical protein